MALELVARGANLSIVNNAKKTAADEAEEAKEPDLAALLEAKLVFGEEVAAVRALAVQTCKKIPETSTDGSNASRLLQDLDTRTVELSQDSSGLLFRGLALQDIRAQKDEMLVTVSSVLAVDLFSAEVLLRAHSWKQESLVEAFLEDPAKTCERANLVYASVACQNSEDVLSGSDEVGYAGPGFCDICQENEDHRFGLGCGHSFCKDCWKGYLEDKIGDGETQRIFCPAFKCEKLVPLLLIEELVSSETVSRYLFLELNDFVANNPNMTWCPSPGCSRAVVRASVDEKSHFQSSDCGNGHTFCFECLGPPHDPCPCDKWKAFHEEVSEKKTMLQQLGVIDLAEQNENVGSNELADALWIAANTKECPNSKCRAVIQKDEGCNHMTCKKCRHDFCWICMEPWDQHGEQTGGFFSCNRYTGDGERDAALENRKMKEKEILTDRFIHYFHRFVVHDSSFKLELDFLKSAPERLQRLGVSPESRSRTLSKFEDTTWLKNALSELVRNRQLLRNSYVLRYYVQDPSTDADELFEWRTYRRSRFSGYGGAGERLPIMDMLQEELETVTEELSGMAARRHLRAARGDVMRAALSARQKYFAFVRSINHGLFEETSHDIFDLSENNVVTPSILVGSPRVRGDGRSGENSSFEKDNPLARSPAIREQLDIIEAVEHAANSNLNDPDSNISSEWTCTTCTLINESSEINCAACEAPRQVLHGGAQDLDEDHQGFDQLISEVYSVASHYGSPAGGNGLTRNAEGRSADSSPQNDSANGRHEVNVAEHKEETSLTGHYQIENIELPSQSDTGLCSDTAQSCNDPTIRDTDDDPEDLTH